LKLSAETILSALPNPKLVSPREPEPAPPSPGIRIWWIVVPLLAVVALVVLVAVLFLRNQDLREALTKTERQSAQQVTDLTNARKALETMSAANAVRATLSTPADRQATAQAVYQRDRGRLGLVANNLPPLRFGQVYQLWLVTSSDSSPLPAGTFAPDERGSASLFTAMPPNIKAIGFEVTTEPFGGTMTPTSKPILTGGTTGTRD
jgi:anti-sigma-K factor RskA